MVTLVDGGSAVAEKDRERLTVYVERRLEQRFRQDADENYRSLSDHMNAILAEYYAEKDARRAATHAEDGEASSRGG